MSEGANVTSGIAMRDPVLPPEKPQKRKDLGEFEKEITDAVAQGAKQKVGKLLENVGAPLSIGDRVSVDGKSGKVVGAPAHHQANSMENVQVVIQYDDNSTETLDRFYHGIKVVRKSPQYNSIALHHANDAQRARRAAEPARQHTSMALHHDYMVKHHEWEGNKEKADEHRALAAASREEADKHASGAARGSGWVPQREMSSKARQARRDQGIKPYQSTAANAASRKPVYQHYFDVPFADKDKAKAAGMKWDPAEKKWYQPSGMRYANKNGPWKFSHTMDNAFQKRHDD